MVIKLFSYTLGKFFSASIIFRGAENLVNFTKGDFFWRYICKSPNLERKKAIPQQ
jgi:hypothetical protein